jgi:hypothetical protein
VEFEGQVYRAPALKIGRRNISSSVIRGAEAVSNVASPRLRRSRFSFLKRPGLQQGNQTLKTESAPVGTLEETNRILVEIQNQLAIDFATRIAERKESILGIKKRTEKDKAKKKEASLESLNKFNQKVSGIFDKVTAPAKNIFQKLMDFFGLIVSGIVINTAFTWLSDKNNQKKLSETLSFVGKYWKEIAGVLIGLQLVSAIASLLTTVQLVAAVLTNPVFLGVAAGLVLAAGLISLRKQRDAEKERRQQQYEKAITGTNYETSVSGKPAQIVPYKPSGATSILELIKSGFGATFSKGGTIPNISSYNFKANVIKQYPNIIQRFSTGGTVGGKGPGNVDSVSARLAPGEEVIKTSMAMLFRPLLKDINDTGGRMWLSFSSGVKEMLSGNKLLKETISYINTELETFKTQLNTFVEEIKTKKIQPQAPTNGSFDVSQRTKLIPIDSKAKGGGEQTISRGPISTLQPVLRQVNVRKTKKTSKAPIVIPMTAPPITQGGGDELIQPSGGTATEEPQVASTNMMNPYMRITPGIYGIFV